ncbi:hypothetical protein Q4Q34_10650 [Flavivirga abyssicola]|uniref:hypothetical protein n=1 Tax=Flavivirga abyssicola TaxID=3063533 RepID=UPI0026DF19E0|nr:hypothetical protein [Flavivirga sp. MEBiC07777]WVK11684.1 hypothetical protein Q4Q34_10650 [Flavivirga sp. MEBiC07777]
MRNSIIKKVNYLLIALLLSCTATLSAEESNSPFSKSVPSIDGDRYVVKEILNKMKDGHYFNNMVTTISEKKRGGKDDWFATYGFSLVVDKTSGNSIKISGIKTSFSSRDHFQGKKTVEEITLYEIASEMQVWIKFKTWNNDRVELKNVEVKKNNKVYFITGNYKSENGTKTTYVTIALKDMGKLI